MVDTTKISFGQKSATALTKLRVEEDADLARLVEDMRRDPYVKLAERDIRATTATAQISVTSVSDETRSHFLAAALTELWWSHVGQMLDCFAYGRAAFEIVWTYVGGDVGIAAPLRLEPLPFKETSPIFSSEDSTQTDGVTLKRDAGEAPLELPNPYGWWLALDATALNPNGQSRFAGAMEDVWKQRCDAVGKRATFIRKYALGDDIVYADPTRLGPNGEVIDAWKEIAEAYDYSEAGDLKIFPAETVPDGAGGVRKKIEVDRSALGARDGTPLINIAKELGSEILLAASVPPRTVLESDSGSFALVTWQMLVKYAVVEDILSQIGSSFSRSVVQPAMAMNGVSGVSWNFVPLTQRPDDLVAEIVKSLLSQPALSPLVASGQVDLRKMLEMAGVPVSSKGAATIANAVSQEPLVQMASPSFRLWR